MTQKRTSSMLHFFSFQLSIKILFLKIANVTFVNMGGMFVYCKTFSLFLPRTNALAYLSVMPLRKEEQFYNIESGIKL